MSVDLQILCRVPLPALPDGWSSSSWWNAKTGAVVDVWEGDVADIRRDLNAAGHDSFTDADTAALLAQLSNEPFAEVLYMNCRVSVTEQVLEYARAVAAATRGTIVVDFASIEDFADSPGFGGEEILKRWQAIDERIMHVQERSNAMSD